ncbi:hypothetical protein CRENBAI_017592 [Crenichthys baileyi]|uniref:E3 ubiquitin-protein ligase TRIM32 n=1 Tax=Crenichthys baileyi TaxID=28760 RepID=A0AAV9S412_9TELE
MFMRSHSERKALPGFSGLLTLNTPTGRDVTFSSPMYFTPRDSIFTPQSPTLSPPWVTEALSTLEKGEQELQSLRERQQTEVEEVNRELDNAAIEAQREERHLLQKVEQDYREAQRHLSQVRRENAAAVRVVQSLVDQQIRKIGQLKEQIQRRGFTADGSNKNQFQRGVVEVTQPWEISLTLKRVSFLSRSQYKTLNFGEVDIHEQGMTYHIGVCGDKGHKCALHSGDTNFSNINPREIRKEPQPNRGGQRSSPVDNIRANSENFRVVRKLHLSSSTENEDEPRPTTSPIQRHCGVSESSQDEEVDSVGSETQEQDLFLAIPLVSSQAESEGDDSDCRHNETKRRNMVKAIDGDKINKQKESVLCNKDKKDTVEMPFRVSEERIGSAALDSAYMVKQFGKQGSGRTDFNLPSGVHATAKGQLFVVDCGNARIQVTDLQKNVVQQVSPSGSERSSRICNYFDVAVNSKGLIALTCAAERALLVFSRHGRLLQTFGGTMNGSTNEELDAPRGVTVTCQDEFVVADIKRGTLTALNLDPKTGARLQHTVVTGYHRPYLVAACLTTGLMAVSERGNETGRVPCIRVLEPGWNTVRILGVCSGLGPVLTCPWGLCIDPDGDVLVADWGKQNHRILIYPSQGVGWPLVTDNLNSPRGLALLPDGQMVVSDSMNHCIKLYRYK